MAIYHVNNGLLGPKTTFTSIAEAKSQYYDDQEFVELSDNAVVDIGYSLQETNGVVEAVATQGYYDSLAQAKSAMQSVNKTALARYLRKHPITFNGKEYGITLEDQQEIALNISQYNIINSINGTPSLMWHAAGEPNVEWEVEDLSNLMNAIKEEVDKWMELFNNYKAQIYNASNFTELNAIKLRYMTPEEMEQDDADMH